VLQVEGFEKRVVYTSPSVREPDCPRRWLPQPLTTSWGSRSATSCSGPTPRPSAPDVDTLANDRTKDRGQRARQIQLVFVNCPSTTQPAAPDGRREVGLLLSRSRQPDRRSGGAGEHPFIDALDAARTAVHRSRMGRLHSRRIAIRTSAARCPLPSSGGAAGEQRGEQRDAKSPARRRGALCEVLGSSSPMSAGAGSRTWTRGPRGTSCAAPRRGGAGHECPGAVVAQKPGRALLRCRLFDRLTEGILGSRFSRSGRPVNLHRHRCSCRFRIPHHVRCSGCRC